MDAKELKKLRAFTDYVKAYLRALDAQMDLPSTPERGRRIAQLSNMLEMTTDRLRFGLLDIDFRTNKPRRPSCPKES